LNSNERIEDPVVADTYAVVDPRAVMVEVVDALIALEAMATSRGAQEFAFKAKGSRIKLLQEIQEILFFCHFFPNAV
tara:strand:- start:1461 stop:1691 length:231 start_codon:yes stop_codon:yes gene_type:complete